MLSTQASDLPPCSMPYSTHHHQIGKIKHDLTIDEVEQDLIRKIVPVVVAMIKDAVGKRIFDSPILKSCANI